MFIWTVYNCLQFSVNSKDIVIYITSLVEEWKICRLSFLIAAAWSFLYDLVEHPLKDGTGIHFLFTQQKGQQLKSWVATQMANASFSEQCGTQLVSWSRLVEPLLGLKHFTCQHPTFNVHANDIPSSLFTIITGGYVWWRQPQIGHHCRASLFDWQISQLLKAPGPELLLRSFSASSSTYTRTQAPFKRTARKGGFATAGQPLEMNSYMPTTTICSAVSL